MYITSKTVRFNIVIIKLSNFVVPTVTNTVLFDILYIRDIVFISFYVSDIQKLDN
jgi:hypothetical protein